MSIAAGLAIGAAGAERILFPTPMHLTREVSDPVSKKPTMIDEYCAGNRIVSISGSHTAIADYDKASLTTIDFAAGTYSVTRFEDIAKANDGGARPVAAKEQWRTGTARGADTFSVERTSDAGNVTIRVKADAGRTLSRDAVEVLLGYAWPNAPDPAAAVIVDGLRDRDGRGVVSNAIDGEYRLPVEHVVRIEAGAEVMETRSVVVRVGNELPSPESLVIPPGARRVELPAAAMRRELDALDRPAVAPQR